MSLGYVGHCKKVSEDDATIFYVYSGADWNNPTQEKADEMAYDGVLAIDKSVLNLRPSKPRIQTEGLHWAFSAIEKGQAVLLYVKGVFLVKVGQVFIPRVFGNIEFR